MNKDELRQMIQEAIGSISNQRFPELEQLSQNFDAGNKFLTISMENGQFKVILHPTQIVPPDLKNKPHITFSLRGLVGGLYRDMAT